jgi:hypothetical protein
MKQKEDKIAKEMARIAQANDGILLPEDVVEAAQAQSSPLHSRFTWDDSKAAHEHRLWQARMLIRVTVNILPGPGRVTERVWVSLRDDRKDGGYKQLVTVLSDEDMREQLLADALSDMEYFEKKYRRLTELAGIFRELKKVKQKTVPVIDSRAQARA